MNYSELKEELKRFPDEMGANKRFLAYSEGKEVDRIPFALGGDDSYASVYGFTQKQFRSSAKVQFEVAKNAVKDFCSAEVCANTSLGLKGIGESLGSCAVYPENDFEYLNDFVIDSYSKLKALKFDPEKNDFLQNKIEIAKEVIKLNGCPTKVCICIPGPVTAAISLREPSAFMKDLIRNKDDALELLEFCIDCNLKWIEFNLETFQNVSVNVADPATSANLLSHKQFLEFSKPSSAKMNSEIKKLTGTYPPVHICGKTKPIWRDLVEVGYPSFSVDNCEDLSELKNEIGHQIPISGNVAPVDVLKNGSIDDVVSAVKDCLLKASDSPCGFTLAAGCQVPINTPRQNLEAFIYAARKFGRGAQMGSLCKGLLED